MRGAKCSKLTCKRKQQNGGLCKQHYDLSMRGKPKGLIDPTPVMDYIKAQGDVGVSQSRLGELAGIPQVTIWEIASGRRKKILASTAEKILNVPLTHSTWDVAHSCATVPLLGTQRRLRALMAAGFTAEMIAPELGVNKRAVIRFTAGEQPFIWANTARAAAELFDKWRLLTGPSKITRKRSASKGWDLPSAWNIDEIDDPNAEPHEPDSKDYWFEEYNELSAMGYSFREICRIIKVDEANVKERLKRRERIDKERQARNMIKEAA